MKKCTACLEEKNENEFHWRITGKKRHVQCKECKAAFKKQFYAKHKDKYLAMAKSYKKEYLITRRIQLFEYLQEHPCIDCGIKDVRVLEFDHVNDDKYMEISKMMQFGYSWKNIKKEIDKCEVRCRNCHRIRTITQFNHYGDFDVESYN